MRKDLKNIPIYQAPPRELLNLAMNENFYFDWENLLSPTFSIVLENVNLNSYGTSSHIELYDAYAEYLKVDPSMLLVGPGSDTLIPLCVFALSDSQVLTLDRDFFRYPQVSSIAKRENIKIPFQDNYIEEMISIANTNEIEMIMLSNPNNPLGVAHSRGDIIRLLTETDSYVIVDEAYIEYYGQSVIDLINQYPKLVVLRTLSKAFGLAGLRVGFVVACPEIILYLKAVQGPFVLNDMTGKIAAKALDFTDLMKEHVQLTVEQRQMMIDYLEQFEIEKIYPSVTNFIYIEIKNAKEVQQQLLKDGIAVSFFAPNGLRMTISTFDHMERLKSSLNSILQKK